MDNGDVGVELWRFCCKFGAISEGIREGLSVTVLGQSCGDVGGV